MNTLRSVGAGLAVLVLAGVVGPVAVSAAPASGLSSSGEGVRVRKDVRALSAGERRDFVEAVLALKAAPSPVDPGLSYYDQFVAWHISLYPCGMGAHTGARAHGGPMFLPWHREFLLRFEDALREVSGKPVTVPYWDWSDPASTASVFAEDLMGGDGNPDEDFAVTTGPFRKGAWRLNVDPIGFQWTPSATSYLTRRFGSFEGHPDLPTREEVSWLLGRPRYDAAPFDPGSDPEVSFRNALEGFWRYMGPARVSTGSWSMACGPDGAMMAIAGEGMHNRVHGWVGGILDRGLQERYGTMLLPSSPNDPVFFLHHANIDRLWSQWQDIHGVDTYEPATCDHSPLNQGCHGNTRTDRMPPFDATPADVEDVGALGYRYEAFDAESDDPPAGAVLQGCDERYTVAFGIEDAVRSRVPARYELLRDPATNRPLVWMNSIRCEGVTVDGVTAPATFTTVGVPIESPDGEGCLSATPVVGEVKGDALPICNFYVLWRATDNDREAGLLRDDTPGFPVWVTDELFFEQDPLELSSAGAPFRFRTGASAPFTLVSDLVVRARPGGDALAASLWTDTPAGTVKLAFVSGDVASGEATGTVRTASGSELAEMLGGETAQPVPGVPLVSALHWDRGVLTKSVVG